MFRLFVLAIVASLVMISCGDDETPTENLLITQQAFYKLDSKSILESIAAAPAANVKNPVLTDADPDVFFINGVVDFVSTTGDAVALSIDVDRLLSDFEDGLTIFITSWDNPKLLAGIQKGNRYTFKVKPRGADRKISRRRGIIWNYAIWCDLIEVIR